jgi:hypothetical protein
LGREAKNHRSIKLDVYGRFQLEVTRENNSWVNKSLALMKTLPETEFLQRAEKWGLVIDPKYPQSAVLTFCGDADHARFWCVPPEPECRPYFVTSFLELFGDWKSCFVWRHRGSWPDANHIDPKRINDVVEYHILKGLGLPLGTADVVEFERGEFGVLATLLFSTTVFGWSVNEDLYVLPDNARYLLQTDHHEVIHVEFRHEPDVAFLVTEMANRGFLLPDELPDETFKQPDWLGPA